MINIGGLAVGMAACLMILQYVSLEFSYDKFHRNISDLYRIAYENYNNGVYESTSISVASGLAPAIDRHIPGLKSHARIHPIKSIVSYTEPDGILARFNEKKIYYVDATFLSMFSFPLEKGAVEAALSKPYSAVLTQATAARYFSDVNPIGKVIAIGEDRPYTITGILKDIPENTHFEFDFLLSYTSLGAEQDENWDWAGDYTYIQLSHDTDPLSFEQGLATIVTNYHSKGSKDRYFLQPVGDIHLNSDLKRELSVNSSAKTTYFLAVIALFTLAIAWFNYINLSTARSLERAKEVGIRKAVGAHRPQLILQFALEAVILNTIAMLSAIFMVMAGTSVINTFLEQPFIPISMNNPMPWLIFMGLFLIGTFVSGIYPALVQSGFDPIDTLKAKVKHKFGSFKLRETLIAFQFAVTVILLIGVFAVFKQLQYMTGTDLGIDLEQTLLIKEPNITDQNTAGKYTSFKDELQSHSQIKSVTFSSAVPGELIDWHRSDIKLGNVDSDHRYSIAIMGVANDFRESFDLEILAGKDFSPNAPENNKSMMLSSEAVKQFGFKNNEEALGENVFIGNRQFEVKGVINDYHHLSLKESIKPILYIAGSTRRPNYAIKVSSTNIPSTIEIIQKKWEATYVGNVFEYFFLDDFFDQQYKADRQFAKIMGIFGGIAIMVACLGLFGLVLHTANQRTKEIGIRKVLGASLANIWILLSKGYLKLILMVSLIILPLAYWGIKKWLINYAYQIDIDAWLFIVPVLTILIIALLTISFQIIKASMANPVDSLRCE